MLSLQHCPGSPSTCRTSACNASAWPTHALGLLQASMLTKKFHTSHYRSLPIANRLLRLRSYATFQIEQASFQVRREALWGLRGVCLRALKCNVAPSCCSSHFGELVHASVCAQARSFAHAGQRGC